MSGKEVNSLKKQILIPVMGATLLGAGLLTSSRIFAQTSGNGNPMTSLVEKIAAKFNLNKADVQAVFDQHRSERQTQMEAQYEAQLNQYVIDGKITADQKNLILAKHRELISKKQSEWQNLANLTPQERQKAWETKKTQMETERQALREWATQNGIDVKYVMGGFGMKGVYNMRRGGMFGLGGIPSGTPAPTPTN